LKDRSLYLAHHLFAFQYLIWSVEGLLLAEPGRSLYGSIRPEAVVRHGLHQHAYRISHSRGNAALSPCFVIAFTTR
jgi:hypothetical protein